MSALEILSLISSAFMIFGGVIPYIPQYGDIKRTRNADGFSPFVCLVLLLANSLRIAFWFGKRFETPLLVQSFVMIAAMLAMVELCVRVRHDTEFVQGRPRYFTDFDLKYFWKWTDFASYVEFLLAFGVSTAAVTYLLLDRPLFVELLGSASVLSEALLGVPQLYRNYVGGSTAGMSIGMVLMWGAGDTFKTVYFIMRAAPAQFYVCGLLQVAVDVAILAQVWLYGGSSSTDRKVAVQ